MERETASGVVFETDHRCESRLAYHCHGFAYLTIVGDGSYAEVCDGVPKAHGRGALVVHAANEEHADYFTCETRCLNIELPATVTGSRARELAARPSRALVAAIDEIAALFPLGSRQQLGDAVARVHALLSLDSPQHSAPPWVRRAMDGFAWLDGDSLRGAARLANFHPTHFSREFRRHVGMTPGTYRRRERVRRASSLLLGTRASLSHIALQCGFSDQSHLTRTFTEELGIAPGAYRRIFSR